MIKAALKHHPEELGFLFQKNDAGETAFDMACKEYGKGNTLSARRWEMFRRDYRCQDNWKESHYEVIPVHDRRNWRDERI